MYQAECKPNEYERDVLVGPKQKENLQKKHATKF
jgi:hypothetical protein